MASFLGIDILKATFHACLLIDQSEAKRSLPELAKRFRAPGSVAKESSCG